MSEGVNAGSFDAWQHTNLQGHELDTRGFPFSDAFMADQLPAEVAESVSAEPSVLPLGVTSPYHKRSYEVEVGKHTDDKFTQTAVWADAHGNNFGYLVTKGNNFSEQRIMGSGSAPSGYIPFGLQEGDALLRVVKASNILRAKGVTAEWIVRVLEPEQLIFGDDLVDQHAYKQRLVESVVTAAVPGSMEATAKMAVAIQNMAFFVTLRALDIPDRPTDFTFDKTPEEAQQRLERIFHAYNTYHAADEGFVPLDVQNAEDVDRYLGVILPTVLGNNMRIMHTSGLAHHFPVPSNVGALGAMLDLDGITGEPLGLGDKPVEVADFKRDLFELLLTEKLSTSPTFRQMFNKLDSHGLIKDLGTTLDKFNISFWDAYWIGRDLDTVDEQSAPEVLQILEDEYFLMQANNSLLAAVAAEQVLGQSFPLEKFFSPADIAEPINDGLDQMARAEVYRSLDRAINTGQIDFGDEDSLELHAENLALLQGGLAVLLMKLADEWLKTVQSEIDEWLVEVGKPGIGPLLAPGLKAMAYEAALPALDWDSLPDRVVQAAQHYMANFNKERFRVPGMESLAPLFAESDDKLVIDDVVNGKTRTHAYDVALEQLIAAFNDSTAPYEFEVTTVGLTVPERINGLLTRCVFTNMNQIIIKDGYLQSDATYVACLTEPDDHGRVHLRIRFNDDASIPDQLKIATDLGTDSYLKVMSGIWPRI